MKYNPIFIALAAIIIGIFVNAFVGGALFIAAFAISNEE